MASTLIEKEYFEGQKQYVTVLMTFVGVTNNFRR